MLEPSAVIKLGTNPRRKLKSDRTRGKQYLWRLDMAGFRGLLYTLAKLMGDYNAVKKGKVGKRVGRRVAGKATGKAMGKLFK